MVKTTDFCHGWPKRAQTDFNCCCVWRIILHDAPMIPYCSFGLWPVAVILHPALCFSGWNSFITGLKQNVSERTANTSRCRVSLQYKGLHMHDCCSTASFYESKLFWSRMHHFPPLLSAWSSPGTSILKIQRMLNLQNFKCSLAQISNMAQSCLSLDCPGCSIEYFAPTIPPKNWHFALQMLPKLRKSSTCASHFSSTAGSAAWIVRLATWIATRYVANCLGVF